MLFRKLAVTGLGAAFLLQGMSLLAEEQGKALAATAAAPVPAVEPLPLDELRNFTQVFDQIRSAYVEEVDDPTLLKNAIIGMLSQLDPHSTYLDESSFEELQTSTQGEFGGLGIEVGMEDGFVKVISPMDDTPAQRAGIKAGDLIVKIDGSPVKGLTLNQAVDKMRGKKGTPILLTVVRKGIDKPMDFTIVRDMIKVISVRVEKLDQQLAYVRIAQFQVNTANDLKKALGKMKQEMGGNLKGIVLDLRNNPGGLLQGAVEVSDIFLESGLVVYTEGRIENANMRFEASSGDMLAGAPIVALINEGSASAAEIVAGALQDHKRAVLVGTQSFGKGSVQTVLPLSDKRAIKLTTARYFTPSGRSIQAAGITPDIEVVPAVLEAVKEADQVKEADLSGHLANESSKPTAKEDQAARDLALWLAKDNQLFDAYNILKALALQKQVLQTQVLQGQASGLTMDRSQQKSSEEAVRP